MPKPCITGRCDQCRAHASQGGVANAGAMHHREAWPMPGPCITGRCGQCQGNSRVLVLLATEEEHLPTGLRDILPLAHLNDLPREGGEG